MKIRPQPGPQTSFLSTPADIAIYGGAAGGGKTWALLAEALRHKDTPGFTAAVFRRTYAQVTKPGGPWDESCQMFSPLRGFIPRASTLSWGTPGGGSIQFGHLQDEKNKYDWQGAQICYLAFDEATHFSEGMITYLMSRNRSTCGVQPYIRMTCNPDPDSYVARLIAWWIGEDGYPIADRAGVVRYMVRQGNDIIQAGTRKEVLALAQGAEPEDIKSLTFIPAKLEDNQILMERDPSYRANLRAQQLVDRERLERGNWHIRETAGNVFRRQWFGIVDAAPAGGRRIRYWDRAASLLSEKNRDPDWTVGTLLSIVGGRACIEDVNRFRGTPGEVEQAIVNTASQDGRAVEVWLEQEPGSSGKADIHHLTRQLAGYIVKSDRPTGDKVTRAKPFSAHAEAGNVSLVRGAWNEAWLTEHENFPSDKLHDDQVDSASGAYNAATAKKPVVGTWGR